MLNVIAVMGRLVSDPELRKTSNDLSVVRMRIACERNFVKAGEQRQADFLDVVAWRATADFASKYFRKGQLIAVNGSLQTRQYEDKQGNKRTAYEIVADNLHFAESKSSAQTAGGGAYTQAPRPVAQEQTSYSAGDPEDFAVIDESEDLPF